MKQVVFSLILGLLSGGCRTSDNDFAKNVRVAVERQVKLCPATQLQDLYKNFMQDRFGPEHLISDREAANRYLQSELDSYSETENAELSDVELIGWEGNYVRVNLSVVKKNLVPRDVYLDAFIRSASSAKAPSPEEWQKEWAAIEAIIRSMNLSLPDYEQDRQKIDGILESGHFAVHHSERFNKACHPHYRIISKEIYEQLVGAYRIRPTLP
ncbi:MAG: hypothetical protein LBT35_02375 [Tannerella sp.]|jgi:hypothetical protein|nr:hypothetical protein [Tannerella sp.]